MRILKAVKYFGMINGHSSIQLDKQWCRSTILIGIMQKKPKYPTSEFWHVLKRLNLWQLIEIRSTIVIHSSPFPGISLTKSVTLINHIKVYVLSDTVTELMNFKFHLQVENSQDNKKGWGESWSSTTAHISAIKCNQQLE